MKHGTINVIVLLSIFIIGSCNNTNNFKKLLRDEKISINQVDDFRIVFQKKVKKQELNIAEIHSKSKNDLIKLRIIHIQNKEDSKRYINNQLTKLMMIFRSYKSSKSESVANHFECDKKYLPVYSSFDDNNKTVDQYLLYSNVRFSFGACNEKLLFYRASFNIIYCKHKNIVYEFSLFTPKDNINPQFEHIIKSFRCNSN